MFFSKRVGGIGAIGVLLCLFFLIVSLIGWQVFYEKVILILLAIIIGMLTVMLLGTYYWSRVQMQEMQNSYRQIESLFSLFSTLKIRNPLPPMRVWAISPDFANVAIALIRERKPGLVVEVGGGISTLITGYCLQELGKGSVVSLEHSKDFQEKTLANVREHQLQDIATPVYAPLKEVVIQNKSWRWYDTEYVRNLGPIDMLIIDGPPAKTQPLARYPALPLLFDQLSDNAVILLDDAFRADEREIVKLWQREFVGFVREEVGAEKGAVILRRQK